MFFLIACSLSDLCCVFFSVSILLSKFDKDTLPVNRTSCAFSHSRGIPVGSGQGKDDPINPACSFPDGTPAKDNVELWQCMHTANCEITDDWLQMVVYRDPRPAVVSAYFYLGLHLQRRELGSIEEFVVKHLPIACQFMAVRHILFSGLLTHQSVEFWYEDSMDNPLGWHYHFLDSVGLQLPYQLVVDTAKTAAANEYSFKHKNFDRHPGEVNGSTTGMRHFEDEVTPELLKVANAILRLWLPPVLLAKLGITLVEVEL